ncbi:BTAD domain-containing putative transcriptional regulator [Streptomyces thermocoprophilus]|uniref:BTAD domain-containing putative transcriptional regulator n=1 Tax=Streptomyces thermocoprophilus TaxID=78356 RepID=A0ABV5VKF0_9ACTN
MKRYALRFGLLGPPVLFVPPEPGGTPAPLQGSAHGDGIHAGPGTNSPTGTGTPVTKGTGTGTPVTKGTGTGTPVTKGTGTPVARPVGSPKLRALLAALLLEAGRVVSVDALKEALWGSFPPATARASLHNHVTRLRRLLDDPDRLRTVPPGYLLRVDPGELDIRAFERHLAAARSAHAERAWGRVLQESTEGLALWRGAPGSGLPYGLVSHSLVERLEEIRLLLLELRYDAELARGGDRLDALVPELAALAAEHPLREACHRQLMLALHRTGRSAEALAVHRDLRARLLDELGVEPGPAVRVAHLEVLRGPGESGEQRSAGEGGGRGVEGGENSPGSTARPGDTGGLPGTPGVGRPLAVMKGGWLPRPAQLPPAPAHFTGRRAVLAELRSALTGGTGAVTVVTGTAGVGKSAVALYLAHQLKERFPDGQLYVHLHGATPGMAPVAPGQALASLLRDVGADPRRIPEHPDAAAALLRSLLAPTRTLLVLDDAASAAQVRPLLPAGPGCAVVITSRSPLTALDGARRVPLAPLSAQDSAALLRAVSGRDGLDADHPLVDLSGRLPLALRVLGARLAARRALTPEVLADQLAATESRLPHLEYDDLSVRRSLAVAHDALARGQREADRDAAVALRHIGALDLPSYGATLVAHLIGADERRAEAALDRLVDVALLEETAYGRYAPHDLVRDFARELAATGGDDTATSHATGPDALGGDPRVPAPDPLGRGGRTTDTGPDGTPAAGPEAVSGGTPASGFEPVSGGASAAGPEPVSGGTPATATESTRGCALSSAPAAPVAPASLSALDWYAAVAERVLEAVVERRRDVEDRREPTAAQPTGHAARVAAVPPFDDAAAAFAWADAESENIVALVERATDAPGNATDARVATLLRLLFPCLRRGGRVAEMEVLGRAALCAARRLNDPPAEAHALVDVAGVRFLTGRLGEALALNDRALRIWRRLGHVSHVQRCLNNRGLLLEGLGRYAESGEALLQSLAHARKLGDLHGEAVTRSHLGNLYEHTDPRAAIEQHRRSLALGDAVGDVIVQHTAHCNIGHAHLSLGEPAAALPHFEESLRILGAHGDWHGESQTRLGLVRALRLLGRTERAGRECTDLLERAAARADCYTGALTRHEQGLLLHEQGRTAEARTAWRSALAALDGTDEKGVADELRALLDGAPVG